MWGSRSTAADQGQRVVCGEFGGIGWVKLCLIWGCACGFLEIRLIAATLMAFGEFLPAHVWADCGESIPALVSNFLGWVKRLIWIWIWILKYLKLKRLLIWASCSCGRGVILRDRIDGMLCLHKELIIIYGGACMVVENNIRVLSCLMGLEMSTCLSWLLSNPSQLRSCFPFRWDKNVTVQICFVNKYIPPRVSTLELPEDTIAAIPMRNGLILGDTKSYRTVYSPRPSSWVSFGG